MASLLTGLKRKSNVVGKCQYLTTQPSVKSASVIQVSMSFIPVVVSVIPYYFQYCSIVVLIQLFYGSKFYDHNVDTTEGTVPSLMICKLKKKKYYL